MRGKNKISAKLKRKQKNVVDAQSLKLRERLQKQQEERQAQTKAHKDKLAGIVEAEPAYDPLQRFGTNKNTKRPMSAK